MAADDALWTVQPRCTHRSKFRTPYRESVCSQTTALKGQMERQSRSFYAGFRLDKRMGRTPWLLFRR
jgi:hypothetical protein